MRLRRTIVALVTLAVAALPACTTNAGVVPPCDDPGHPLVILLAQAVPSATIVPCVATLPAGWSFAGSAVEAGRAQMWLSSLEAGDRAVELTFTASCDPGDAVEIVPAPDEAGARVLQAPTSLDPYRGARFVQFEGGCVHTTYAFAEGVPATQALEADAAFGFVPRAEVVAAVASDQDAVLCGADAPPCEGSR
jgi:FAD/FMN-containing dehydrogenase